MGNLINKAPVPEDKGTHYEVVLDKPVVYKNPEGEIIMRVNLKENAKSPNGKLTFGIVEINGELAYNTGAFGIGKINE